MSNTCMFPMCFVFFSLYLILHFLQTLLELSSWGSKWHSNSNIPRERARGLKSRRTKGEGTTKYIQRMPCNTWTYCNFCNLIKSYNLLSYVLWLFIKFLSWILVILLSISQIVHRLFILSNMIIYVLMSHYNFNMSHMYWINVFI